MATTLGDGEIDIFIDWLSEKEMIGKQAIQLCINAITELKADRALLKHELDRLKTKGSTDV